MNEFLDIYTIVFLALAVFVIFRLRSVLGQRTGTERPPFNPFERPEAPKTDAGDGNVIPLPTAGARPAPAPSVDPNDLIKGIAEPESAVGLGLKALVAADSTFDPKQFVMGARAAYEMIVQAFARGDRKALKDLLARDVMESFGAAIGEREARGDKVDTTFVSIDKSDVVEAGLKGNTMQVTVRFASKLITATRDSAGTVIAGNPEKISDLVDVWTFAREAKSRDPNWRLVETDSAN